jgi:transcriptional regulator with XRE-family HTH domain
MTIGQQIRQVRKTQGLTLRELSRRTGMAAAYLSDLETDKRESVGAVLLWRLCAALGLCPCDVLRTAYGEETSE